MDRIITMVINQVIRRFVNIGISKGIDLVAGKGKPAAQMTADEMAQSRQGRETAKNARQMVKMARRLGR
ncbi:MAG: hypothetical protein WBA92_04750 [Pseudorhodobacter sp.]